MYEFPRQSENPRSRVPPTDFASFLQANHDVSSDVSTYHNNRNDSLRCYSLLSANQPISSIIFCRPDTAFVIRISGAGMSSVVGWPSRSGVSINWQRIKSETNLRPGKSIGHIWSITRQIKGRRRDQSIGNIRWNLLGLDCRLELLITDMIIPPMIPHKNIILWQSTSWTRGFLHNTVYKHKCKRF